MALSSTSFNIYKILTQLFVTIITIAPFIWLGIIFSKRCNLKLYINGDVLVKNWIKDVFFIALIGSTASFITIYTLDATLFNISSDIAHSFPKISPLYGLIASLYGAINEEVLFRLFMMPFIMLFLNKLFKCQLKSQFTVLIGSTISSLFFGLAHIPAAALIMPLNTFTISRIIILNMIPGFIFGLIYSKTFFEVAVLSHFIADIFLHVLLPLLS